MNPATSPRDVSVLGANGPLARQLPGRRETLPPYFSQPPTITSEGTSGFKGSQAG